MANSSNFPQIKNKSTNSIIASVKQQRIQKLLNSIDLFNGDLSNTIETPLNDEDQKRIEEILNEKSYDETDSYNIISQLHINPINLERINEIDKLLAEMKAGHASTKNIPSSIFKSKYTKSMKTLDELKAEMYKIDEVLVTNRKNREAEQANESLKNKKAVKHSHN